MPVRNFLGRNNDVVSSVIIPDSVSTMGMSAFSDCSSLKSISIPDSVTGIGSGAFFWLHKPDKYNYS